MMQVADLEHDEQSALNELYKLWTMKLTRNRLRSMYYHQRNALKDLGIAIPPELLSLELVLGWPAKAVDELALLCRPDKFVIPGMDVSSLGVAELWRENDLDVEFPQTVKSGLMHSCAFMAASKGDVDSGEPAVLMTTGSAMFGAGIWDARRRALRSAMAISALNDAGMPTEVTMWLPDATIHMRSVERGWSVDRRAHSLGRVPVEVLPYKPSLDRPFGSSRISRAVMGLADSALRTAVRTEVAAEFFSAPQRWMMGATESMFVDENGNPKGQWAALIGRVWAAPPIVDDTGYPTEKLPQVGEFRASPQTPNLEHLRSLAMQFCGETSLTPESLGVIQDNPTSAESIAWRQAGLVRDARANVHDPMGSRVERAMLTALQIRDNLEEIPAAWLPMSFKWRNPETMTESAAADSVSKLVAVFPWMSESKVALERLGWDDTTIERAWADKRKVAGGSLLDKVRQQSQSQQVNDDGDGNRAAQPDRLVE